VVYSSGISSEFHLFMTLAFYNQQKAANIPAFSLSSWKRNVLH